MMKKNIDFLTHLQEKLLLSYQRTSFSSQKVVSVGRVPSILILKGQQNDWSPNNKTRGSAGNSNFDFCYELIESAGEAYQLG